MSSNDDVLVIEEDDSTIKDRTVLQQLGNEDDDPTPKQIFNAIVALSLPHQKLTSDVSKFQKETSAFLKKNKSNIERIPELVADNKKMEVKVSRLEKCIEVMQQKEKDRNVTRNVIINVIPKVSADRLPIIFKKITKIVMGSEIEFEYISAMNVKPGSKSQPIVIRCVNSKVVYLWSYADEEKT